MHLKLLSTLKLKMQTETDLFKIWEFFLDHFGEEPGFFEVCVPTDHPLIVSVMADVCRAVTKLEIDLTQLKLFLLPEYKFVHGGVPVGKFLISVIYFEETMQGVVSVVAPFSTTKTHMARFTLAAVPHFQPAPASFDN